MGEIHGVPGIAAFVGQGRQRDGVGPESDDVVGADHALIAEAEAAGEVEARGQGAEIALGLARRDGEALVVIGAEAGEDLVGGVEIAGLGEAEGFLYYEKGDISSMRRSEKSRPTWRPSLYLISATFPQKSLR